MTIAGTASGRSGVLVTGGAGYVGSHVVRKLLEASEDVVVVDDLSNAYREAAGGAEFHQGDVLDYPFVDAILRTGRIGTIMHFAASALVSESIANPGKYYRNNVGGMANLLLSAAQNEIDSFIFSSSAAVYGITETGICREDSPTKPVNSYGKSKLMSEEMLRDVCDASGMRHVILRYFNVAGAAPAGQLGQRGRTSSHLIKVACEVAAGKRDTLEIYGNDYETPDGTCVRDYVHVEDLAAAHVAALRHVRAGRQPTTLNCGYGKGHSVRQVIRAVERAAGKPLPVREAARRPGDPPVLVAASERIGRVLGWSPEHDSLDLIVASALAWERSV